MLEKDYKEALSVDAQGRILVSFVIDNKGYMVDYLVLNNIHPQLDKLIESFISKRIAKRTWRRICQLSWLQSFTHINRSCACTKLFQSG